jgi:dipeptidyl aminopeptidase/acylaminoacyl peptidase
VRTTSQLFSVPTSGGTPRQLSDTRGVMSNPTYSRDGTTLAFTRSDPQHPGDVHMAQIAGTFTPVKLTDQNPQVKDLALGRADVVRWKSSEGMEIEGIVVYPIDYQPGRKYPTMAFIHGGPSGVWTESFPSSWGNFAHVWAGKGWVSFFPNIRGSSGYGEKFQLSNVRDWGGGDFRDIQAGLDDLVKRGIADPARLGQSGWSYGGYMTAWTLTQTDRFKGVMVGAGLTNMYSMYSTNDLQTVLEEYFGGEPWNDEQAYRRASAMTYIKQAKTPSLIMHGAQDQRVPVGQAQELYMGLKKNGVPVELVFYPRQGHGIGEPRLQLDKMKREYAFFAKYVLGEGPMP